MLLVVKLVLSIKHLVGECMEMMTENHSTQNIIIDEMSMVSADLIHKLRKNVSPGQRLVMIGDADQLPPVGPGEPLMQMIESELFPVIRFD